MTPRKPKRRKVKRVYELGGTLPLKTRLQCLIGGWNSAAFSLRQFGRIDEAKQLELCAATLKEAITLKKAKTDDPS